MGIAGFTEWFLKTFPRTVTKIGNGKVPADHVFIDFNQFVHKVSRSSRNYNVLWKKMYRELDTILNITNPRQSVYIVMDGPASRAKLIEQRKHRKTKKSSPKSKKVKGIVDRRMITPGCRFTGQILNALSFFICQRLASRKYEHIKFYVSGANVAGEGELKIMKYISSMPEKMRTSDSFALVGSDADLVLLAIASRVPHVHILNALHSSTAHLVASVPTRDSGNTTSQPPRQFKSDTFIEIGIDKLIREFSALVPQSNSRDIGVDFVALSIMSGNDYLPKVPTFFINQYWDHYVKARRSPQWSQIHLVDPTTNRLNLDFLDSLLRHSPARPLANPPVHHHRKLARLRQLRADLASGVIDKEDVIRRYTIPVVGAGAAHIGDNGEDELLQELLADEENERAADDDDFVEDDDDELDDASAMDIDETNPERTKAPTGVKGKSTKGPKSKTPSASSSPAPAAAAPTGTPTQDGLASSSPAPTVQVRDPIDIFLEIRSRDTWKDYDADDHTSEFIYGLEWVINSYLRGECVNNDWFFPYSSAPGPKQIRDWIAKAKVNPSIIKAIPMKQSEGASANSNSGSVPIPIQSSSQPTSQAVPNGYSSVFQPWMFAMMLLDSTTYNFVSPSIPTHLITPDSYVHEVHDPSYFFGFVDSDRMAEELSKLQIPAMSPEDAEYSYLGNIRMFERSYDRSGNGFIPKSPFEEDETASKSRSLYGSFRRVSVPDLHQHHIKINQAHSRHRSSKDYYSRNDQADRSTSHPNTSSSGPHHPNQSKPHHQQQSYRPNNGPHGGNQPQRQGERQYYTSAHQQALDEQKPQTQQGRKNHKNNDRRPTGKTNEPEQKKQYVPAPASSSSATASDPSKTRINVDSLFSAPVAPQTTPYMAPAMNFPNFMPLAFPTPVTASISSTAPLLPGPETVMPPYGMPGLVPPPQIFASNPFTAAPSTQPSNPFLSK